jgi:hypothetical protein
MMNVWVIFLAALASGTQLTGYANPGAMDYRSHNARIRRIADLMMQKDNASLMTNGTKEK